MTSYASQKFPSHSPVFLVDDHDEAYEHWKKLGVQKKTLIHLDAHMDFEWIAQKQPVSILESASSNQLLESLKNPYGWSMATPDHQTLHLGNYLHQALKESMIKTWYWVVPDPMWDSPKVRNRLWKDLLNDYSFRTGPMDFPKKNRTGFETSFLGVPTYIGPLRALPQFSEPVLLNIDADYLTATGDKKVSSPRILRKQSPWIWPEELDMKLHAKGIVPSVATISYSVNGGYTPIAYKFFGEAMQTLLTQGKLPQGYRAFKEALSLNLKSGAQACLTALNAFTSRGDLEIARLYQKSLALYESGQIEQAADTFRLCASLDLDFVSSYNSNARFYESQGLFIEALDEYTMMKVFLPDSVEIMAGEARCFAALNQLSRAKAKCLQVLERDSKHPSALFVLAKVSLAEHRFQEAVGLLQRCFEAGSRSVMIKLFMGECFYNQGRFLEAKAVLREGLGAGGHFPVTYFLLAKTYWRLGYYKKSIEFFAEWARLSWRKHYGA